MEFIRKNYIDTITSISISSNTITVENILNWDKTFQYSTEGFADDTTIASITFNFDETVSVSRIALLEHNLKSYTAFYNGVTANTFSLNESNPTATSDFSSNSNTAQILSFAQVDCTSVTIDMKQTIEANNEKAIGYALMSDLTLDFERDPSAKNYSPIYKPDQIVHKMADGGTRIHNTGEKFSTSIKFQYISPTFRENLREVHQAWDSFVYLAVPTSTGWDEIIHEVVWPGNFEFYKYSDNAIQAGFGGKIDLREIS